MKDLRYEWIWEKTQATGGMNSKRMPMKAHENVMVFYKKTPDYYPIKTFGHVRKVSSAKNRAACIVRRNEKESYLYNKEYADKVEDYDSTERYPRSVIEFPSDKQKLALHETQKPEALLEYIVKTYTKEGDIVVDPCRGSNTTGVVCDRLGRGYYGIENDEYYYNIGILRRKNPKLKTKELKGLYESIYG